MMSVCYRPWLCALNCIWQQSSESQSVYLFLKSILTRSIGSLVFCPKKKKNSHHPLFKITSSDPGWSCSWNPHTPVSQQKKVTGREDYLENKSRQLNIRINQVKEESYGNDILGFILFQTTWESLGKILILCKRTELLQTVKRQSNRTPGLLLSVSCSGMWNRKCYTLLGRRELLITRDHGSFLIMTSPQMCARRGISMCSSESSSKRNSWNHMWFIHLSLKCSLETTFYATASEARQALLQDSTISGDQQHQAQPALVDAAAPCAGWTMHHSRSQRKH